MATAQGAAKNDAPLAKEPDANAEIVDDPLGGFIVADEADDGEEGGEFAEGNGTCENGNKTSDLIDGMDLESSNEPDLNHPLRDLIENYEPPANLLGEFEISGPAFMGEFPVHEVTSDLAKTAEALKKETEIGVYCATFTKEYQKQLCYLVISTKTADYLIDLLAVKDVTALSEVFADPNIVKVLFNTKLSLYYLQQQLKLYCINIFAIDTALETLGQESSDLNSILLGKYGITRLENLDFTKRPLDMLLRTNLQSSSHFLVHLYRKLHNQLLTEKKDLAVLLKSMNKACLLSYKSGKSAHREALINEMKAMHQAQLAVLERLNLWRNRVAKVLDKNPNQVLNKQCLKVLSMLLPEELEVIKNCGRSDYVKKEAAEIQKIIRDARTKFQTGFVSKNMMTKFLQESAQKRAANFQEPAAKKAKVTPAPVQTPPKTPAASPAAKPSVTTPKPAVQAKPVQSTGGQAKTFQSAGGQSKSFQSIGGQARNYQNQGGQAKSFQAKGGGGGQFKNYQGGQVKNFQSTHGFSMRPNPAVFGSTSSSSTNMSYRSPQQSSHGGYSAPTSLMDHRLSAPNAGNQRMRSRGVKRRMRPMGGELPYDPFARN